LFLCSQTNFWRWGGVHDDVPRDRDRSCSFRDDVDAHDDVPRDRVHSRSFRDDVDAHDDVSHDRVHSRSFQDGDRGGAHDDVPRDRDRSRSFGVWETQRYVWKLCVFVL